MCSPRRRMDADTSEMCFVQLVFWVLGLRVALIDIRTYICMYIRFFVCSAYAYLMSFGGFHSTRWYTYGPCTTSCPNNSQARRCTCLGVGWLFRNLKTPAEALSQGASRDGECFCFPHFLSDNVIYFSSFRWPSGKCFRAFTACSIPNLIKHESNRNLVSAERSGGSKAVACILHPSVRKVCAACCSILPPVTPRQNNRRLTLSGAFPIQTTLPHNRHCNTKFLCTLVATSNCFPSK